VQQKVNRLRARVKRWCKRPPVVRVILLAGKPH
jgi:hypothetical protein